VNKLDPVVIPNPGFVPFSASESPVTSPAQLPPSNTDELRIPLLPGARVHTATNTQPDETVTTVGPIPDGDVRTIIITGHNSEIATAVSQGGRAFVLSGTTLKAGREPITLRGGSVISVDGNGALHVDGKPARVRDFLFTTRAGESQARVDMIEDEVNREPGLRGIIDDGRGERTNSVLQTGEKNSALQLEPSRLGLLFSSTLLGLVFLH
jgi:hypothetical protein